MDESRRDHGETGVSGAATTGSTSLGPLRAAVQRLLESDSGLSPDLPDREVLVADLRWIRRAVEARLAGEAGESDEDPIPSRRLHARAVLALLRRELVRGWEGESEDDPEGVLRILRALDQVEDGLESGRAHPFAGDILEPYAHRLLREIAHTLRSPITSMTFLTDAMREGHSGPVTDVQERQLTMLYRAALVMGTLVEDILVQAGGIEEGLDDGESPTPVARLLEEACDTIRPICEERSVELEVRPPEPPLAVDRPRLLRRVLANLALMGVGRAREGSLFVGAEERDPEGLRFVLRASGENREPWDPRIFREEPGDTYSISKDGLRFATVARLLREIGSRPVVTETPDRGFEVHFEVELPPQSSPPASHGSSEPSSG